ncbi:MAG: hypothetical protein ACXWTS_01085 [Methylococcaceae bacterium]
MHEPSLLEFTIINKTDLLPYVDFDLEHYVYHAKQANPAIEISRLSSTKGDNFSAWTDWLIER